MSQCQSYDLKLSIGYRYGGPSDHARMQVRLLPSNVPGRQRVAARLLTIDPSPHERRDSPDFFGNLTTILAFHDPIDRIEFSLRARTERLAQAQSLDLSPDRKGLLAELAEHRSLEPASPHHYLGPSKRLGPVPAIADFAAEATADATTIQQKVIRLGQALHSEMAFDATATDVDTAPDEAFAARHGVCQDFTHIMIVGLRALGIPAGYVSGFLRTEPPPGQPRLEGADAMHAWVSAWCGSEMGWIEFDPTNACAVDLDHITVAFGRDYADVAPVKGSVRTASTQSSHQRVDVIPVT